MNRVVHVHVRVPCRNGRSEIHVHVYTCTLHDSYSAWQCLGFECSNVSAVLRQALTSSTETLRETHSEPYYVQKRR